MSEVIDIFLFENHDIEIKILNTLFSEINAFQNSFVLQLHTDKLLSLEPSEIQSWDYLTESIKAVNNSLKYKIGILSNPIENNWFSATSHENQIAFITTHNWEYLSELSVYSYLLFEIIENFQEVRMRSMHPHYETIGCINDMCGYKLDIGFKIKTGWICQDCLLIWNDYFTPIEIEDIQKILDYIRLVALNRKHIWKLSNYYPFPVAVRFKIMQSEQNSYIKFQKLLDLYDAIIRYVSFTLLSSLSDNRNIPKELEANKKKILKGDPTLGTWEYVIRSFVEDRITDLNMLSESDMNAVKEMYVVITSENIRRDRNDYRGHNYTGQNLEEYLRLYLSKIEIIQKLLSFCDKSIFKYILAKIERIRFERGQIQLTYRRLMGDSIIFDYNSLNIKNTPYDEQQLILLHESRGDFISVYPYIQYLICQECNHERILYWDGVYSDSTPRFIDTLIGHRTKSRSFHC